MIEIAGVKCYTINEVAAELQIRPETARKYIKEKKLDAQKVGRRLLVPIESLRKFLKVE